MQGLKALLQDYMMQYSNTDKRCLGTRPWGYQPWLHLDLIISHISSICILQRLLQVIVTHRFHFTRDKLSNASCPGCHQWQWAICSGHVTQYLIDPNLYMVTFSVPRTEYIIRSVKCYFIFLPVSITFSPDQTDRRLSAHLSLMQWL